MADAPSRPPCVLLANLEPVALVGMTDVLTGGGVDVVVANGAAPDIVDRVRRIKPDVLLLDGSSRFALLAALAEVEEVWEADGPRAAEVDENLELADVLVLDGDVEGSCELVRKLRPHGRPRVLMCAESLDEPHLLDSVQAGACGYLTKDTLTPETLAAGVRAVHSGAGILPPDLLGTLLRTLAEVSRDVLEPRGLSLTSLTTRERNVLRLVAEGLPTREVAQQLSYSERTIKAVMHDVTTKLHAKSRSQAVALAVREGLI